MLVLNIHKGNIQAVVYEVVTLALLSPDGRVAGGPGSCSTGVGCAVLSTDRSVGG